MNAATPKLFTDIFEDWFCARDELTRCAVRFSTGESSYSELADAREAFLEARDNLNAFFAGAAREASR